jgi:branched-chain amino acid transport system substrate-binding protein
LVIAVGVLILALTVAALPFIGACTPTEKTLKVGFSICMTGPLAEKGSPTGHAKLDCVKYINQERGGVNGYPVEAIWYDNAYDATKGPTIVRKLMDDGCLFFTTSSPHIMSASMEIANRAGFPGFSVFSSPVCTHPPQHIYGQTPDYGDDALAFARFYMDSIWEGTGKPRFALHLLNNPIGYGVRDAYRAKADELGIEIVITEEHTKTTISEMESLTRIKAANPDVLFISSTPAPTSVIMKDAYGLGLYPGIVIGCAHASFTKALIDMAGADVVEGVYGAFPTVMWGEAVPGMAKATKYCQKYHPEDYGNTDYLTSWAEGLICAEILRLALENCGYNVLAKGDAIAWECVEKNGIQKLDYDVEGLQGRVSYMPGDNRLTRFNRIYQIVNGEITNPSAWIEVPVVKYEEYQWFK